MADEVVHYDVRDRIAYATIDNGKANALSPDVLTGLEAALDRAEAAGPKPSARCASPGSRECSPAVST